MANIPGRHAYTTGTYTLDVDGLNAGWLASAGGGLAVADVVEEKLGAGQAVNKHIAAVKYTDLELECGTGMTAAFYQWIKDTFDGKYQRKSGALITTDYHLKEQARLSFANALISAVGFPALDGASKDAARLTVRLSPEFTQRQKGTGTPAQGGFDTKAQKKWSPANFKLEIDGLDCTRVNRIEPIVVKTAIVENAVGELRDYQKEPAHLELSDLVVTLAESHADTFYTWHENFVIKGNSDESHEKSGILQFQTLNQETLFTLTFSGLGIYKLAPETVESATEAIRRVTAYMYCQRIAFSVGSGTAAQAPPQKQPAEPSSEEPAPGLLSEEYSDRFTRVRTIV